MDKYNQRLHEAAKGRRARALKMRESGKTLQAIATRLGVTHQRVSQILKAAKKEANQGEGSP